MQRYIFFTYATCPLPIFFPCFCQNIFRERYRHVILTCTDCNMELLANIRGFVQNAWSGYQNSCFHAKNEDYIRSIYAPYTHYIRTIHAPDTHQTCSGHAPGTPKRGIRSDYAKHNPVTPSKGKFPKDTHAFPFFVP